MKKKITYTDEPLSDLKVIPDFLPSPESLVFKEDSVSISISLNNSNSNYENKGF